MEKRQQEFIVSVRRYFPPRTLPLVGISKQETIAAGLFTGGVAGNSFRLKPQGKVAVGSFSSLSFRVYWKKTSSQTHLRLLTQCEGRVVISLSGMFSDELKGEGC
eukprot:TRINITY_DN3734_c1_g1_i1.p1 TRINITY_DN3734_c1_g1~~TRINITY_DN3734_c1_g1_i1.p1  ORF type:complete len:105 (+),score=1.94 TRINITY_DN3734_c1_g1_i1:179-493(+)